MSEKNLRIVHLSVSDSCGAGLCAYRICKAQRSLGFDANMVVLRKKHNDNFIHTAGQVDYFMYSLKRKVNRIFKVKAEVNTCRRLGREHNAVYTLPVSPIDLTKNRYVCDADVIHIHWVGGFIDYPSFFTAFADKTIVFTLHDESILYGIASIEQQLLSKEPLEQKYYQLKKANMQGLKHVGAVFLSNMNYELYGQHEMITNAKKTIIYNMVDCEAFAPVSKDNARKKLKLPQTKLFGFCAYSINDRRKGLKELSKALLRIDPAYRILAIGKNRERSKWENVIETGFHSSPEGISQILSAADYFCMPSFKENFAQAPLEAMACGLPVIAFPCSGTSELITPCNGIRCNDYTVDALEAGIRQALKSNYDRTAIRQDMLDRFSPSKIATDYINFYQSI